MKEYIKILDDLRAEEIRFDFDPLNKNLCFGGTPVVLPKIKIGGSLGDALDKGKETAGDAAAAAKAAAADTAAKAKATAAKAKAATQAAATKAKEVAHAAATTTKSNAMGLATDAKAEFARQADAGKAFLHEGADQFKEGMQKLGLHKSDDPGSEDTPGSSAAPGGTEKVGGGSSNITMKEAESAKGKKAKMGAKGKRSLRKI